MGPAIYCESCGGFLATASQFCGRCGQRVEPAAGASWGLERFTFSGILGQGGTGTVYLAHDAVTGADVAVKLLDPKVSDSPGYLERFFTEVKTLKGLSHDNVARIVDHGRDGTQAWLATEYVPGGSLRQLLEHDGRLTAAQALGVLSGALAGLVYVHGAGVLHGDITPGNILVDPAGTSKLTDFGSAIGPSGRGFGVTAAYASPEAAQGLPLDVRSDVYSMGVVLYECLSGHQPFSGASDEVVLHRHLTVDPPPIEGLERPLHQLMEAALAKDPEQRPQSAAELLARLEAAADLAEGPTWRERASVAALAAIAGGELGALVAPALLGSDAAAPHAVAQRAAETAARHGSAVAGAASGGGPESPATGPVAPGNGPPASLPRRIAQVVSAHKVAAVTTAAVLATAGVGAGVLALKGGGSVPSSQSATSAPATTASGANGSSNTDHSAGSAPASSSTTLPSDLIADPAGGSWSQPTTITQTGPLDAVSCPTPTYCFAVGGLGYYTFDGSQWSGPQPVDPSYPGNQISGPESISVNIQGLSCPSAGFCVMIASGVSGEAFIFDQGTWTATQIGAPENPLNAISCASDNFCVVLDDGGHAYTFNGSSWSAPVEIDVEDAPANLGGAVSCATPTFCMAVTDSGKAVSYANGVWSAPTVVSSRGVGPSLYLGAISCPTDSFCIALGGYVGGGTQAFTYDGSSWSGPISTDNAEAVGVPVISCATRTFCKAIDKEAGVATFDGSGWLGPATLGLDYADGDGLISLSCPTTRFCMGVVGQQVQRFYGPS